MAYLGTLSSSSPLWGGWVLWRKQLEHAKWFQRAAIAGSRSHSSRTSPAGCSRRPGANPGWSAGLLETEDAVSSTVSTWTVALSLGVFAFLYTILGCVDLWLMRRYARVDPPEIAPGRRGGSTGAGAGLLDGARDHLVLPALRSLDGLFRARGLRLRRRRAPARCRQERGRPDVDARVDRARAGTETRSGSSSPAAPRSPHFPCGTRRCSRASTSPFSSSSCC